ncbi:ubiquinone biosynthesis accessory factor UbiJ [Psychromonas ossibalaenae]|uniref:ubiquinone biosynthesis accessory factor UbiJ n=1 Tax=Psychromonas ossibalaenae TaxID=444922 RepID=UPI00035C8F47|nr:SCP2 sterol-binding domain-containing protein [Psychromonas ossibalaenae]
MPLDNLLCGLLESGVNKLHLLDASAQQRRKQLDGLIIGVSLKEINKPLYFVISTQQIDILAKYEGQPDCFIRLNISALKELQNNHQLTRLIKTEQLEVEGDIQIVQQFAQLLTEMDIDGEEVLSTKIGDVLAHKLCYHLKQCTQSAVKQLHKIEKHSAEYITEELRLAPGPLEVMYFCEQVNDLHKETQALEKRIEQRFSR